jgi:hypothetical protein
MVGDMLWDVLKSPFKEPHPVKRALEFRLHVGHSLGVRRGDSRDAPVGLPNVLHKGGPVSVQSITGLGLGILESSEEGRHVGIHRKTSRPVKLNESNRFGREAVRILTNEANVPAHVRQRSQNSIQIVRGRGSDQAER